MTSREQLIRARLTIIRMAAELKNVAKVCKSAGVSRSQFYAMKKAYRDHGIEGLAPRLRRTPHMPNRTSAAMESVILLKTAKNPSFSYVRLAGHMNREGIAVTPTMVRYVWQRVGISTRSARIQWLKKQREATRVVRPIQDQLRVQISSSCDPLPATVAPSAASGM